MELVDNISILEILLLLAIAALSASHISDKRQNRKQMEDREKKFEKIISNQSNLNDTLSQVKTGMASLKGLLHISVPERSTPTDPPVLIHRRNGIKIEEKDIE